jgi:hypothetical protein
VFGQIGRHKEREKYLTRAICAFLESFRFPLTGDSLAVPVHWGSSVSLEHATVSKKVGSVIIPALKKLVHWESKTPRITLAFAIARLCKAGPPHMARAHLPGLLNGMLFLDMQFLHVLAVNPNLFSLCMMAMVMWNWWFIY